MTPETRRPLIFDIHRYALDDGPGIRTTVFFKGCPLACCWCHNPEGMQADPQLYYLAEKCIACGDCVSVCPRQAITLNGTIAIDRSRCDACGRCADQCPAKALCIKGRFYTTGQLIDLLLRDKRFFDHSGGGVTFSGGEPTLYPDYLRPVLGLLKDLGVHVALQTCGWFVWDRFEDELLPWIDQIYFDIKSVDAETHREWTGRSNQRILTNFARVAEAASEKLICTIPLISHMTAEPENLARIARFLRDFPAVPYRLNPYHPGGHFKTAALGRDLPADVSLQAMGPDQYHHLVEMFDTLVGRERRAAPGEAH